MNDDQLQQNPNAPTAGPEPITITPSVEPTATAPQAATAQPQAQPSLQPQQPLSTQTPTPQPNYMQNQQQYTPQNNSNMQQDVVTGSAVAGKRPILFAVLTVIALLFSLLMLSLVNSSANDLKELSQSFSITRIQGAQDAIATGTNFYNFERIYFALISILFALCLVLYVLKKRLLLILAPIAYGVAIILVFLDPFIEKAVLNSMFDSLESLDASLSSLNVFNTGKFVFAGIYLALALGALLPMKLGKKAKNAFVK